MNQEWFIPIREYNDPGSSLERWLINVLKDRADEKED